jgi:hypothetical protein
MSETITATHLSIALFALWFLYFFGWREHRLDSFRRRLFEVRDGLFDYASSGAIGFDDPAYTTLRSIANGMIRFAHQITFTRVLVLVGFSDIPRHGRMEAWMKDVESRPPDVREKLLKAHSEMAKAILWHVVLWSPLAWMCLSVGVLAKVAANLFSLRVSIAHTPREISAVLEREALEQSAFVDEDLCTAAG